MQIGADLHRTCAKVGGVRLGMYQPFLDYEWLVWLYDYVIYVLFMMVIFTSDVDLQLCTIDNGLVTISSFGLTEFVESLLHIRVDLNLWRLGFLNYDALVHFLVHLGFLEFHHVHATHGAHGLQVPTPFGHNFFP